MSSPVPSRPAGIIRASTSALGTYFDSWAARSIGVSTVNGGIVFTWIPLAAYSSATVLVSAITPPFDAE